MENKYQTDNELRYKLLIL